MCKMFALFFGILLILFKVDESQNYQVSPKIINGLNVKSGTYRFIVSIHGNKEHVCGGAILNDYYVLTAAHCFNTDYDLIQVKAGITNLNASEEYFNVEIIIIHKKFSSETGEYDIALLKMKKSFSSKGKSIQHVILPNSNYNLKVNLPVFVAGWGRTEQGDKISFELKKAKLVVADQNYCEMAYEDKDLYPFEITERHFCMQSPSGERGICYRDSGGPVVIFKTKNKKKVPLLLGIVSWSGNCGNPEFPDVLTKVSKYLTWINSNAVL